MSGPLDALRLPVTTDRLLLRRATPTDADATWTFRGLPEVSEWTGGGRASLEDWREAVLYGTDEDVTMLICLPDGRVIGDLMVIVRDAWAQREVFVAGRDLDAELGWTLHPDFGGQGYASEAIRALIELCFTELGVRRVTANCFTANEPSWRLMERVGMRREAHTVRDSLHRTRGWLDGYAYALLREEWEQAH